MSRFYQNHFVLKSEATQAWFKEHFKHLHYSSFYEWIFQVLTLCVRCYPHHKTERIRYMSETSPAGMVRFYDTVFVGYYQKEGKLPEKVTIPARLFYGGHYFYINRLVNNTFVSCECVAYFDNGLMSEKQVLEQLEADVPELEIIGWINLTNDEIKNIEKEVTN